MGLLDIFKKKESAPSTKRATPREIARLTKLAGEKLAQNYDRQEALEELARIGSPEAAAGLLRRFTFAMEPSITDQEEKEMAAAGLVSIGEDAIDPIREYCVKAASLTWPIKILRQIVEEDALKDELLAILEQFDTEYVRNADPKAQLINALEEFVSEDVRLAVEPFLQDMSEPVRFHAVSTVVAMGNPESVGPLIAALEEDESLRVRNRIAQKLAETGWAIPSELTETCTEALPEEYQLRGGVVVHR
ncbi:MAG: HEAT repeat domain-containing protein [Polyangiaceae bacterium]|nr:HEAT repeat domain-containing protein [Polyangiaceae bacterium]MCW5791772.1 HEAT repeat domain-containing protein [Polyangiaceae bacterium]